MGSKYKYCFLATLFISTSASQNNHSTFNYNPKPRKPFSNSFQTNNQPNQSKMISASTHILAFSALTSALPASQGSKRAGCPGIATHFDINKFDVYYPNTSSSTGPWPIQFEITLNDDDAPSATYSVNQDITNNTYYPITSDASVTTMFKWDVRNISVTDNKSPPCSIGTGIVYGSVFLENACAPAIRGETEGMNCGQAGADQGADLKSNDDV